MRHYGILFNGVYSKNKLPTHLKSGYYIINMQNQNDGQGTHWVVMKYNDNDEIIYCDSMGLYPPVEVMQKTNRT